MHHYKACGLDNVFLVNGYKVHPENGNAVSFEDFEGLQKALASFVVDRPRLLTGAEFRFLRNELELSQKALAAVMHKTDQTIANWEKGKTAIPLESDLFLRQYYLHSIGHNTEFKRLLSRLIELDCKEVQLKMAFKQRRWHKQEEAIGDG